jgi:hypothetical protein
MTSGRDLSAPRANFKPGFAQNAKSTAHQNIEREAEQRGKIELLQPKIHPDDPCSNQSVRNNGSTTFL